MGEWEGKARALEASVRGVNSRSMRCEGLVLMFQGVWDILGVDGFEKEVEMGD